MGRLVPLLAAWDIGSWSRRDGSIAPGPPKVSPVIFFKDRLEDRLQFYLLYAAKDPRFTVAQLAIRRSRRSHELFDRPQEIRDADIELSLWLRRTP